MRLLIHDTEEQGSAWTARYIADAINLKAATTSAPFVLGLPTGSTPVGTYRELIRLNREGYVSFRNVITFNMDEYVGLPEDHPQSYHSFMKEYLFDHIDINPDNINILNGNAPDLHKECEDYEKRIESAGGIDLFLGGVGEDGHIAFNEPFSSMSSRTRIKTLNDDTVSVNARFFDGDTTQVPRLALTVGVATVLSATEVVILAFGAKKAEAVHQCVEGPYSHSWTITGLQTHRHGILVVDEPAAGELKVNTYKYFKSIEK